MTASTGSDREHRACLGPYEELFRRHADRLWSVAVRMLGNPVDAEDVVQEAFVSVLRSGGYRGEADVGTWLYRIVVNKCIDRLRRVRVAPDPASGPAAVADPSGRVATRLVVDEALALLPADQRAAVVLVDVYGHPTAEAARMLDVPAGTVKSRCARGRTRLAELLGHLREER